MTFNPDARLDPDQVTDVRGRTRGGRGLAIGGGGLGLVIAIAYLLLGGDPAALINPAPGGAVEPNASALAECETGADANARADCRIVGFVNSIQAYWTAEYGREGTTYRPAETILYSDAVSSGCGNATSAVGPFYCPPDESVYIDLGFFGELQSRFGAEGGPWPRRTSSLTSTATTSRISKASSRPVTAARAPRAMQSGPSSRRTVSPASGSITRRRPTSSSHPRTTRSSRR